MTGTIKVSPDKLLSTSAEFSSQGNTIISLTGEMMNIVASMSSVWEGEAASSYMTKFKSRGLQGTNHYPKQKVCNVALKPLNHSAGHTHFRLKFCL